MENNFGITEEGLYLVKKDGVEPILIRKCNVFIPSNKSPIRIEKLYGLADDEIIYDIEKNVIFVHPNNKDFKISEDV